MAKFNIKKSLGLASSFIQKEGDSQTTYMAEKVLKETFIPTMQQKIIEKASTELKQWIY